MSTSVLFGDYHGDCALAVLSARPDSAMPVLLHLSDILFRAKGRKEGMERIVH